MIFLRGALAGFVAVLLSGCATTLTMTCTTTPDGQVCSTTGDVIRH